MKAVGRISMDKSWDARLAARLVAPLRDTAITPNHLTTVRLATGAIGVYLLARGALNAGAWLVTLSNFLDHTDGELARMTGKGSRFGHIYDLATDALITIGMFLGLGLGIAGITGDHSATAMGAIAGLSVAAIFQMRSDMEERLGKSATRQPNFAGFEPEDILYLLPAVTHGGFAMGFLKLAAVGAPLAALVVLALFVRSRRGASA
jgi:phosphatidylglycerophosphate synthase